MKNSEVLGWDRMSSVYSCVSPGKIKNNETKVK